MELVINRLNGILVAEAWTRVDGNNAGEFEKALREAINDNYRAVIIDFEHLAYISSAGLRVILLAAKALRNQSAKFGICSLANPIREVFEVSGFDKIIPVHESRADALAAVDA